MTKPIQTNPHAGARPKKKTLTGRAAIDALYERERASNLASLEERRRQVRSLRSARDWAEYWPVAIGIVMGCFAPQLRALVELAKPWGLWVVFPLAAMIERPELAFSREFTYMAPTVALYAQFPLEGLLARWVLRGHVTVKRVLLQTFFLHFLGTMEMWMVNGPWGRK